MTNAIAAEDFLDGERSQRTMTACLARWSTTAANGAPVSRRRWPRLRNRRQPRRPTIGHATIMPSVQRPGSCSRGLRIDTEPEPRNRERATHSIPSPLRRNHPRKLAATHHRSTALRERGRTAREEDDNGESSRFRRHAFANVVPATPPASPTSRRTTNLRIYVRRRSRLREEHRAAYGTHTPVPTDCAPIASDPTTSRQGEERARQQQSWPSRTERGAIAADAGPPQRRSARISFESAGDRTAMRVMRTASCG